MRNLWVWLSVGAGVVAISVVSFVTVYKTDAMPGTQKSVAATGNPLLTASRGQLEIWYPDYCGADLYVSQKKLHPMVLDACVNGVIREVEQGTGILLTREDVLNPAVKTYWRKSMGVDK